MATALSASGLLDEQFFFVGFLPSKKTQRQSALQAINHIPATLVFYEAPHRIADTLEDLRAQLGEERQVVIARELTKLFEEIHRCKLADVKAWLVSNFLWCLI